MGRFVHKDKTQVPVVDMFIRQIDCRTEKPCDHRCVDDRVSGKINITFQPDFTADIIQ